MEEGRFLGADESPARERPPAVASPPAPPPIRHSLRMAPEDWSFFPTFLGARIQYSMHPWKQYECSHAIRWPRGDSASRNRSAAALLSFRGGGALFAWGSNVRKV